MKKHMLIWLGLLVATSALVAQSPLPGTKPLTANTDLASDLVAGVDRFLLRELDASVEGRARHWKRDFSSIEAYHRSVEPNRKRLAHILGMRDARVSFEAPELLATTRHSALVGKGQGFDVFAVRWPALEDVHGEGLLLVPTGKKIADIVALPDADQSPEQLVGLVKGIDPRSQFARRLAESGCRVLVPTLISRKLERRQGRANLTNREYLYRPAFELGRHLIGYELQKILAAVDWFSAEADSKARIGVLGYGEGGMLALYAGALDRRIDVVGVSGFFGNRQRIWEQPIDRNVFGLLDQFGDAEIASLIAPRAVLVESARGPELTFPGQGGASARLTSPTSREVEQEVSRFRDLVKGLPVKEHTLALVQPRGEAAGVFGTDDWLLQTLRALDSKATLSPSGSVEATSGVRFQAESRQLRQVQEIDRHTQRLLEQAVDVRGEYFKDFVDLTQRTGARRLSLDEYQQKAERYRKQFYEEVIGKVDQSLLPFNARSRLYHEGPTWTAHEVVLDVFPDVMAYGVLVLPKNIKPGEKRPVVVCQHGLEGRPKDVLLGDHPAYHDYAAKLAERGFITFAPQNLYLFGDRFRTLQRKANPLKKTLFSIIVPQHQQIVNWLKTLPQVDEKRIAFYGLSYGGKTAMRVPPLVPDYCLSICSADFNDWVWKNASTRAPYSYVWTNEYEIFEFDLGSTFNYAEMAALIAPRPFMVERGHFDGVAPDERVALEFAKVRFLYSARLGVGDRTELEWFVGPHTIHGKGTFEFLHRHLQWPKP